MINIEENSKALERKHKLDKYFEFTPSHISRIIYLNEQLKSCEQELIQQSIRLEKLLLSDSGLQPFLSDYEIECRIELYLPDSCYDGDTTSEKSLMDSSPGIIPEYCFKGKQLQEADMAFYDINWNEHFERKEFQHVRFCYAFHHFVDHTCMSMQDLIRIEKVWGEVEIKYQKCLSLSPPIQNITNP